MTILKILYYPDKRLHLKATKVESIDESTVALVNDMLDTMYAKRGIGLSATQVNVQKRIFVMDLSGEDEPKHALVFINPEIIRRDGEIVCEEGCLSVPGIYEKVLRADNITLKHFDLKGKEHLLQCCGLMAVCIQHEIDHLDGKVFVDYLSRLKRDFIRKKMKKTVFKPE